MKVADVTYAFRLAEFFGGEVSKTPPELPAANRDELVTQLLPLCEQLRRSWSSGSAIGPRARAAGNPGVWHVCGTRYWSSAGSAPRRSSSDEGPSRAAGSGQLPLQQDPGQEAARGAEIS